MIVLVTGGRDLKDANLVNNALDALHSRTPIDILVHGCATGADTLAASWAIRRGVHPAGIPALWDYYGKPAGGKRNRAMLLLHPAVALVFPGGIGTADMCAAALNAGLIVYDLREANADLVAP